MAVISGQLNPMVIVFPLLIVALVAGLAGWRKGSPLVMIMSGGWLLFFGIASTMAARGSDIAVSLVVVPLLGTIGLTLVLIGNSRIQENDESTRRG